LPNNTLKTKQKINPIQDKKDIAYIRNMLSGKPRDLLLFDMCTQTGMLIGDLIKLKAGMVRGLKPGDSIPAPQSGESALMNQRVHDTMARYLKQDGLDDGDYLFKSRKGNAALDLTTISHLIRKWFLDAGLKGLTGSKSLRKTYEYHFRARPGEAKDARSRGGGKAVFGQIRASTLGELVRSELVRAILSGRIAPGERVFIKKIAQEMEVSSMPVRDALARLEASGFVSYQKNRAYVVNSLSKDKLLEIAKLRNILEPMAAVEACKESHRQTRDRLLDIHAELEQVVQSSHTQVDQVMQLNKDFHFALYSQAHMPILLEMIGGLWDKVSPYLYLLARESEHYDLAGGGLKNHLEIIRAVSQRDCEAVSAWVRADIDYSTEIAIKDFF
jgi:DNA-binding GntR family transcriptional regulator